MKYTHKSSYIENNYIFDVLVIFCISYENGLCIKIGSQMGYGGHTKYNIDAYIFKVASRKTI